MAHAALLENSLLFISKNLIIIWFSNFIKHWLLEAYVAWMALLQSSVDYPLLERFFGQLIWVLSEWFYRSYLFSKSHSQ